MPEQGESSHDSLLPPEDIDYLHNILGIDRAYLQSVRDGPQNEYDWVITDALEDRYNFRVRLQEAAVVAGIEVDESEVAGWSPSEIEMQALHEAAAPLRKRLRMTEGMMYFVQDTVDLAAQQGVPLRPHQLDAGRDSANFMLTSARNASGRGKSGAVIMPTGDGKTATFAQITAQLKHGEDPNEPVRVLVLTPTQKLVEQTEGQGGLRGFEKFAPHLDVGKYYQYSKDLDKDVVIMTTNSFNALIAKGQMPHFDAVIVDEVHESLGETTAANLMDYTSDKVMMGFTATDRYDEERTIYNLVDHKIHEVIFQEAVAAGRLAPIRGHLIQVTPEVNLRKLSPDPVLRSKQLRLARLKARIEHAKGVVKEAVESGRGVIIRCPAGGDIGVAVAVKEMLQDTLVRDGEHGHRWLNVEYVGGSPDRQSRDTREEILTVFDNTNTDVLTYVKALRVGWDSSHAKVFINLAPSTSSVEIKQGVGRVARLLFVVNEEGEKEPVIADAYDYAEPTMRNQYTTVDAIGGKSGELIGHGEHAGETPIPRPRHENVPAPEVLGVDASVLGSIALDHTTEAEIPDVAEVSKSVEMIRRTSVDSAQASRILGISQNMLRKMLRNVGSSPTAPIPKSELVALIELLPGVLTDEPPQDISSLVPLADFNKRFRQPVRMYSLLPFARDQGITPYRLPNDKGIIGIYFTPEEADRLEEMVKSGQYRLRYYSEHDG